MRKLVSVTAAASLLLLSACSDSDSDSDPSLAGQALAENEISLPSSDDVISNGDDSIRTWEHR